MNMIRRKTGLIVLLVGLLTMNLVGCTKEKLAASDFTEATANLEVKEEEKKVEFNPKEVDLTEFKKEDEALADFNNDGEDEIIELWCKGEQLWCDKAYAIIKNTETGEVLTSFECGEGACKIGDINDITGDKVKDIAIIIRGGNTGNFTKMYVYDNKEYRENNLEYIDTNRLLFIGDANFTVNIIEENSKLFTVCSMEKSKQNELISDDMYNEIGVPLYIGNSYISGANRNPYKFKDVDKDGVCEILVKLNVFGKCHAQGLFSFVEIYKYENNNYKLIALQKDDSEIISEPLKWEEEKTTVVENNSSDNSDAIITIEEGLQILMEKTNISEWKINRESKIGDKTYYFYSCENHSGDSATCIDPVTTEIMHYYVDGSLVNSQGNVVSKELVDW